MTMALAASNTFSIIRIIPQLCPPQSPRAPGTYFVGYSLKERRRRASPVYRRKRAYSVEALLTNPDDFEVGRFKGSYGFMNITSYSSSQSGGLPSFGGSQELTLGLSSKDIEKLSIHDVGEGKVKIRLYEGRVIQGPLKGTRVIFKVYPGRRVGGVEADMMAANELSSHTSLQDNSILCQNIQMLLGGFETKTGEQWLALRDDGKYSASDYAKIASENIKDLMEGSRNPFAREPTLKERQLFVVKILNGAMRGLAFMHDNDILHQSLGPASIILNTIDEKDAAYLAPRLRDLAFSVDISYSSLEKGPGLLSEGLWCRALAAGASTLLEKRAFGIAEDIYEAGLLFAYLAFVPFCEAGIIDGISLQRLFESTFKLDLEAAREYCLADDHLLEAVKFLDLNDRAGWQLLQAMLNPDYRQRPIAEAVLNHRFMTGAVL